MNPILTRCSPWKRSRSNPSPPWAAIARGLEDPARQRQALNLGLALALVFRLGLIVAARWVLNFWPLQLAAAAYLLWLCGRHLLLVWSEPEEGAGGAGNCGHPGPYRSGFFA
ncbi:MAG: hypothetical protein RLZZ213_957 [Cyanobacteriota bacterium]